MTDIFLISVPKSGTNMIDLMIAVTRDGGAHVVNAKALVKNVIHPDDDILRDVGSPSNSFVRGHLFYHEDYEKVLKRYRHCLFIRRDLRDCLVSSMFWDSRTPSCLSVRDVVLSDEQIDIKLMEQIEKWKDVFPRYVGWLKCDWIHKFKYEDFVLHTERETKRLANILGAKWNVMLRQFRSTKSHTFRAGRINDWTKYFKPHHLKRFWEYFEDTMYAFGYERND